VVNGCLALKCGEVRAFLSQVGDRQEPIAVIPPVDVDYLSANGYVERTTKEDRDKGLAEVTRISQMIGQANAERAEAGQVEGVLKQDEKKEHSFVFHFEKEEAKEQLREKIATEETALSKDEAELAQMDAAVNALIEEKSRIDRMAAYDGGYVSLTGLGTVVLNDLNVRNYRVSDEEFPEFALETKATYAELRTIADRASSYALLIKRLVRDIEKVVDYTGRDAGELTQEVAEATSLMWATAIGLAKLRGDTEQLGQRFTQAVNGVWTLDSTTPNKLMAAEIMTALTGQDVSALESDLKNLEKEVRRQGVPKELSAGVAAAIMAGRRFDGTYPMDRFAQFRQMTKSYEAAAILAAMNVPFDGLNAKFQGFRSTFTSWGYMTSEDTEVASAFLAIGELEVNEVEEKLKYIELQLRNYLEYPLVAAAILASIPVFEAHEALDLMEKAVTLLSGYVSGLERSVLVALAVRMIHGVRNELVKQIDPTATITSTPVQFTYAPHPGLFVWFRPVIIAHSSYHATFSGMGGFHPAHSHGIGGFAG
jgi:hypothetical protein